MFLKLIDMAIADYESAGAADDVARLRFFRSIWGVQEKIIACTSAEGLELASPQALRAWNQEAESVLSHKPLNLDAQTLADACSQIAAAIVEQAALSAEVNEALSEADWQTLVGRADVALAGKDPAAYLEAFAECALDVYDEDVAANVVMVGSLALRTQLEKPAARIYEAIISAGADIPRPTTCPVCGSQPTLARVGVTRSKNGRAKELWCSQCGTAWEFERVRCGRCGTQNQNHLHYFSLEGDDTHRLQNCDECGNYIRTVYQEEAIAVFSYEVEDVVMAKLDEVAYQQALNQQQN